MKPTRFRSNAKSVKTVMKIIQAPRKAHQGSDDNAPPSSKVALFDLESQSKLSFVSNQSNATQAPDAWAEQSRLCSSAEECGLEGVPENSEGHPFSNAPSRANPKSNLFDRRTPEGSDAKREKQRVNIVHKAVDLLARREHSVFELKQKLSLRGYSRSEIRAAIEQLLCDGLVCDDRFTEAYVRHRVLRGFGPNKIAAELSVRGVDNIMIEQYIDPSSPRWLDLARDAYAKKFGDSAPEDYAQWTKRARFLQGRGFSASIIQNVCPPIAID